MTRFVRFAPLLAVAAVWLWSGCPGPPSTSEGEGEGAGAGEGEGAAGEGEGTAGEGEGTAGEGEGEGEGTPDTPEDVPAGLEDAVRAAMTTCLAELSFLSDADKQAAVDAFVLQIIGTDKTAANDADATFDATAVAACIADLQTPRCVNGIPAELEFDSCAHVVVGLLHGGAACDASQQCISDNCDFASCTCSGDTAPPTIDADAIACFTEFDCPLAQACQGAETDPATAACVPACGADADCTNPQICTNGVCVDAAAEGAGCLSAHDCGPNLVCDDNAFVCVQPRNANDPCSADGLCGNDALFCDQSTATPVCKQRRGQGLPCTFDECDLALACLNNTTCGAAPSLGQACNFSGGALCGVGLRCDDTTTTCVAASADGASCFQNTDCVSGICDGSREICVGAADVGLGADCSNATCGGGLVCATETGGDFCRARVTGRAENDPCSAGVANTCPLGLVCSAAGACVPVTHAAVGDPCSSLSTGPVCDGFFTTTFCKAASNTSFTGVCTARPAAGDPCPDNTCTPDAGCDTSQSPAVCVTLRTAGEACDANAFADTCAPSLVCENGKCVPLDQVSAGIPAGQCVPPTP